MPILVVKFPKLGVQTSTWVDDEWWATLTRTQQEIRINRFVQRAYPHELVISKRMKYRHHTVDYTWNEM